MVLTRWLSQPSYTVLDGEELSGNPRKSQGLSPFLRWLLGAILLSATFAFGCMSAKTARDVAQYQTTSETEQIAKTLSRRSQGRFFAVFSAHRMCSTKVIMTLTTCTSLVEFGPHEFVFNRTFGEDSSAAVKAWEDLFPRQGGYFRHPVITPQRATFSVYHYLHCLVSETLAHCTAEHKLTCY